jgi:hypothetical protein
MPYSRRILSARFVVVLHDNLVDDSGTSVERDPPIESIRGEVACTFRVTGFERA